MIIDNAGTYTLRYTATDDCGKTTTVDRELKVEEPVHTYGIISRDKTSSVCERIGDSALFAEPVPQHSDGNGGWVDGSSPFDNIMPWSGMEVIEDAEAGTLVSIPKFYYKWTRSGTDGEVMQLEISPTPQEGFLTSPAHADRGDGVGERDIVYVGRYHCASNYKSQTGVVPFSNETRSTFRSGIHNLGANVWQWDFATYWTIAMLYLVEFADWDSQKMIGGGCSDNREIQNTGLTDSMTYHTGTTNTQVAVNAYGHIQYRHIEDLWANVFDWCDGLYFNGDNVFAIKNPANFSESTGGTNVGTRATTPIWTQMFTDPSSISGFEYALYVKSGEFDGSVSRTQDSHQYSSSGMELNVGGSYIKYNGYGLFWLDGAYMDSGKNAQIGSRLMKLPNA